MELRYITGIDIPESKNAFLFFYRKICNGISPKFRLKLFFCFLFSLINNFGTEKSLAGQREGTIREQP